MTNYQDGTVTRIDPTTNRVIGTVHTGSGADGALFDADAMWVVNDEDYSLTRVDPAAGRVVASTQVGPEPRNVVKAGGTFWLNLSRKGTVLRLRPI